MLARAGSIGLLCLFVLPAAGGAAETLAGGCPPAVRHRPADDVAFRPGLDVKGKAVAPADLDAPIAPGALKQSFDFDLVVNPIAEAGLSFPTPTGRERFEDTAVPVATVTVDPAEGVVALNGRPVSTEPPCPPR